MISFDSKGDFSKLTRFFERALEVFDKGILDKYGRKGVEALQQMTPKDTGLTASSWYYNIENHDGRAVISFHNSNINDGVSIAMILQYGHGTQNGGWVEGVDYINPALDPIFNEIVNEAWREVIGK